MEENYENVTLIDDLLRDNASTIDARTHGMQFHAKEKRVWMRC